MRRIYLDHAATSPLLPEAREAMLPWLDSGNPSSLYQEGRRARSAIDEAREVLSDALGCLFAEVLFTSGGTEAANLAILGTALAGRDGARRRVLLSSAEHHCVLGTQPTLEALGFRVEFLRVDRFGRVDLPALSEALGEDVLLISAMHANNETGAFNDVAAIGRMAHACGALYHCDAVQTFGRRLSWSVDPIPALSHLPVDMLTISAHKIGGPKAVGAIFTRAGHKLKPLVTGGGQEREVRGGTENVAGIVGFAAAVRASFEKPFPGGQNPRDAFLARLTDAGFVSTCASLSPDEILPSHAHVRLPGLDAETLLVLLDRAGVSASSGAACSSGSIEPSHVLLAAGYSNAEAKEGLRFSFGSSTRLAEAEEAAGRVICAANEIRAIRSG